MAERLWNNSTGLPRVLACHDGRNVGERRIPGRQKVASSEGLFGV